MKREDVLQELQTSHREAILAVEEKSAKRVYIEIQPEALHKMASHLFWDLGARFNTASGVDTRSHIEILYHFILEEINLLISLRVKLDREHPKIVSLTSCFEAANWIEREIHELLGVEFVDHPDPRRLLLPDNWPEGVFPLRQDYREWDPQAIRDRGV
ncbi:MAG: NADH-quinone oxidoreductase subunit C [Candidatus Hydrogenedentota bacterium]